MKAKIYFKLKQILSGYKKQKIEYIEMWIKAIYNKFLKGAVYTSCKYKWTN